MDKEIYPEGFSLTNILLLKEAERRGWISRVLDHRNQLIEITPTGKDPVIFNMALSNINSGIGHEIATNKDMTRIICETYNIPYPESIYIGSIEDAEKLLAKRKRIVVKPADTDHGVGITTGVEDTESLSKAIEYAKKYSDKLIAQEHIDGYDHRFLVVGDEVVAVGLRKPPYCIGDGKRTISQLLSELNDHEWRGSDHGAPLSFISEEEVKNYVGDLSRVPTEGEQVQLLAVSNLSQGGFAVDLTDQAHQHNKDMAIELAKKLDLAVAGVDILSEDISKGPSEARSTILEINKIPGIRMHHYPMEGTPRDAAKAILDQIE